MGGANLSGTHNMTVLYLVLPLALVTVLVAVLAFSWATRSGQFDDLDTPGLRVLHDDTPVGRTPPEA
jgi:cbb3-type cytochrome oxidase maturation protein